MAYNWGNPARTANNVAQTYSVSGLEWEHIRRGETQNWTAKFGIRYYRIVKVREAYHVYVQEGVKKAVSIGVAGKLETAQSWAQADNDAHYKERF